MGLPPFLAVMGRRGARPPPQRHPRTLARKVLYAVAVTFLVFGAAEALVRTFGRAPPPLPGVARATGTELVVGDETTTLRQGPDRRQDAHVPTRKGVRPRVVVIGESSVRGAAQTDSRYWFPDQLALRAPDLEVVNLGAPGQSLAGLRRLIRGIAPLAPDLVVVYTGHNEFSHPIFAGEVTGSRLWMLPLYRWLGRSWLVASAAGLGNERRDVAPPRRKNGPVEWVTTTEWRLVEDRARVLARFRADYAALIADSPAPVLVTTLLRNFDWGPTGVWVGGERGETCRRGLAGSPKARPVGAVAAGVRAACGPDAAVSRWMDAHDDREAGRDAASAWRESLARDPLPLRAPLEADDLIREIATERDLPLVDLARALGPYPEGRLFTDTLHPSPAGAQAIAEALEPAVRAALGRPKVVSP